MSGKKTEYTNGELTVVWRPERCIHSERCIKGLPGVFVRDGHPWIQMQGAATEHIRNQVKRCPSGALSCYMNNGEPVEASAATTIGGSVVIEPEPNGPLLVHGKVVLQDASGKEIPTEEGVALCRCGHSQNKPFCDGTHELIGFKAP